VKFEQYKDNYEALKMERRDGILQITFHTEGGPLQWGRGTKEIFEAFSDIGSDFENKVMIMTGTGQDYVGPHEGPAYAFETPRAWEYASNWEGVRLVNNLLDIQVPVISAVHGQCVIHAQLPMLADIVLASEDAVFQDSTHFPHGIVPGDGVQVVWPLIFGTNRGRYYLLTGKKITAQEGQELGLVAEVLPREKLLPRAWELAEDLAKRPLLTLRYSRLLFTEPIKRHMRDLLGYGMALEGLGFVDVAKQQE
jgi:enoyl-CoA hydratase/carnithine racemase